MPDPILLISDSHRPSEPLARTLALLGSVTTLSLADGAPDGGSHRPAEGPDGRFSTVVADIDLRDARSVSSLRRCLMPGGRAAPPTLCLLDGSGHDETVQAWAIGASAVMPVAAGREQLLAAVLSLAPPPATVTPRVSRAVPGVGAALADLLEGAASGTAIRPAVVADASVLMLDAIGDDGIGAWLDVVRTIDDITYQHCLSTAGFVAAFALRLGFSRRDGEALCRAALVHDIGKGRVPLEILGKQGGLSPGERAVMREHAALGHELLVMQGGFDSMSLEIARHHHEFLDGSGYPDGLAGAAIPDHVRIMTICDIFGALTERRPYKPAMAPADAMRIMGGMDNQLDGDLLHSFRDCFRDLD
ncbi:HD-GYP domain-containing protein [Rhizosaccharibacter radicis]|uniref:HD domain-containing protein n=1 Tax=Rhizosaccharibacter radicis TaxID=2782605 RepID=A0ABT1VSL9_9PROT|nr:HD domain-containing protein [Acetobacteraceae bacterium KSS12]